MEKNLDFKYSNDDFDITVNEKTQFIKYKSPGGHFRPHSDTSFQGPTATFQWKDDPPNEGFKVTQIADAYLLGSVRKISSTLLLNDEFSGGGMSLYYMALNDKENASWSLGIEEVPLDLKAGDLTFKINGPIDLIEKVFEIGKQGTQINRYKGLGEMNPDQLWETTLDKNYRSLLSVKIEELNDANQIFETLMGDLTDGRKHFIQENSLKVANLDI